MLADAWSMSEVNLKNMQQNLWGAATEIVVYEQDLKEDMGEIVTLFQDIPGFSKHGQGDTKARLNNDAADTGYQILIEEIITSVCVEECAATNKGNSDYQEEEVESRPIQAEAFNVLQPAMVWCKQQSECSSTEVLLLQTMRDL